MTTETNDLKKQTRIFRQRLQVMLESQLEVVKSDEWDKLLATDSTDKYDEIQKILGASLDKRSDDSVESSTTSSNATATTSEMAADQPAVEATDTDVQTPVADGNTATTDAGQTVVVFPDDDGSANN